MRKILSLFLALTMVVSCSVLTSCQKTETITCDSCGEENPNTVKFCSNCGEQLEAKNNDDKKDDSKKTTENVAKQKLCEYIMENGANYQGTYKIIELGTSNSTTISYTEQGDIVFSYYNEGQYNTVFVTLKLYDGSVTQTVEYQYEQSGYTCTATGTLYTNMVSYDDCSLSGVTYRDNFPSSVSQSTIEDIVNSSDLATKTMLASVNAMLVEYVGITLKDLGFTNW